MMEAWETLALLSAKGSGSATAVAVAAATIAQINMTAREKAKKANAEMIFLLTDTSFKSGLFPAGATHNWGGSSYINQSSEDSFSDEAFYSGVSNCTC